jgi:hypothetical protein
MYRPDNNYTGYRKEDLRFIYGTCFYLNATTINITYLDESGIGFHSTVPSPIAENKSLLNFKIGGHDNKGAFSTAILKYFGLKHIQIDRRKKKINGQYSYKLCSERATQVNKYYELSFDTEN